jgi:hypothetical protein
MSKFTKGPWVVSSSFLVCNEDARVLARCDSIGVPELDIPFDEAIANARLIAAAPDLLNALQLVAAHYPHWATHFTECQIDRDTIAAVRAAIAKAES